MPPSGTRILQTTAPRKRTWFISCKDWAVVRQHHNMPALHCASAPARLVQPAWLTATDGGGASIPAGAICHHSTSPGGWRWTHARHTAVSRAVTTDGPACRYASSAPWPDGPDVRHYASWLLGRRRPALSSWDLLFYRLHSQHLFFCR